MKVPLQVTYRNFSSSEALHQAIESEVKQLEQVHPHLVSCRVMVEQPHRHQQKGRHFHVRIDASVPGQEFIAGSEPSETELYEDAYQAVQETFRNLRRQLSDHERRRRTLDRHQDQA